MMLSMSTMDQTKVEKFEQEISETLLKKDAEKPFETVKNAIEETIKSKQLSQDISVHTDSLGIQLDFSSKVLYESGAAQIRPEMISVIKDVSETIKKFPGKEYVVKVEGHTDDEPINTSEFPSNWELSASRATNIVRYFIDFGIPKENVIAIGLADARPIAPNRDKRGLPLIENQAKNRRVVVLIHRR
jgi:chemotaxis protein MotB